VAAGGVDMLLHVGDFGPFPKRLCVVLPDLRAR
jgi:hypothetical protein